MNATLDYWNAHRYPYCWKKKPKEQVNLLGAYGVSCESFYLIDLAREPLSCFQIKKLVPI